MTAHSATLDADYSAALAALAEYSGAPAAFWPVLIQTVQRQLNARAVWLVWRPVSDDPAPWKMLAQVPSAAVVAVDEVLSLAALKKLAHDGVTVGQGAGAALALAELQTTDPRQQIVLIADMGGAAAAVVGLQKLTGFLCVPQAFDALRKAKSGARDATRLAQTLESMGRVLDANSFDQAALTFVNDLSERFACETVSLSWWALEGLRLRATSHSEKVARRSEATSLLEEAGQEALTQDKEVMLPATDQKQVSTAHEAYVRMVKPGHILTLPLMQRSADGQTTELGAVTLERQRQQFSTAEQWALRLYCEMAIAPLIWHAQNTKWLVVRMGREIARSIPKTLKPRSGAGKLLMGTLVAAVVGAMFIPLPFRLSATAVLKTDASAYVGAAYDGFIEGSQIILGSVVEKGDVIFTLNTSELVLERNALIAELAQSNRDAEIRRSVNQLSEMLVAQAKADELRAKLLKIDQKLAGAAAKAPISGVVVEGEPAKKIGEAVRRGESQVTISALSSLYVEAAVSEKDLSFIAAGQPVELTLLARPKDTFTMSVARAVPAPEVQDADNVFPVRMSDPDTRADWWVPGMTGVVKISAGTQPVWWLASRSLVDYLRLLLWF